MPDDPTRSGEPRHSEDVSIDGDGNYATVDGFEPDGEGTSNWVASYSRDANNEDDTDACGDEPVVVAAASVEEKNDPSISTQPDPASGEVGTVLNDTATLGEATGATYSGDAANNPASSGCDEEQVAISDPAQPADPAPVRSEACSLRRPRPFPKPALVFCRRLPWDSICCASVSG
ncbi:MAG: hypothetical protein ACRDI1_01835 [Actinomycetota bacterium]